MDLFEKIEQFEKMALELLQPTPKNTKDIETIEEYTSEHLAHRVASAKRLKKLALLAK